MSKSGTICNQIFVVSQGDIIWATFRRRDAAIRFAECRKEQLEVTEYRIYRNENL
jgi:hypothetical protein